MIRATSKWMLYNVVVCFAVYWLSNLLLWYPWSVNELLGQVLMLTINPLLWGYASYSCLTRYPKQKKLPGVFINSLIFLAEAIASDLLFFIVIRHAADKLLHPTTFYAWGFVLFVPFPVYFLFRKRILNRKQSLTHSAFFKPLLIGLFSLAVIVLILLLHIRFD